MSQSEQRIFEQTVDLSTNQRDAKLAELCEGDEDLRKRVRDLLDAHDAAGEFMAEPTTDMPSPNASKITEKVGDSIDRYKLLESIGEGGFGVVYMAQQTEPVRRRVALKVIKLGMDTRQVVARFEAERQALAMMDHINIAKVLDGGATASGRPYFVMELVRGDPITEYCDREKLKTRERLELFQQVCAAIQHAHQKGIIHRDIKPSNVLVTVADGMPLVKVIDFGIAKATNQELTEKTLFTEFRQLIGTPQYMSPEQAERSGVDIDTRSDIYSLGVLLYEMLTGRTPIDPQKLRSAQWGELQRLIREEEATKPSVLVTSMGADVSEIAKRRSTEATSLRGSLKGDLDWIVMRAIEKDRTRRYETASQFSDDIGRFLVDQPVDASPPSVAYRVSKFAKRNRTAISIAALVTGLLIVGLVGTTVGLLSAMKEKRRALAAFESAAHSESQAIKSAEKASIAAERANRVSSMLGSPIGLLPEAEVERLSKAWKSDIADLKEELGTEHEDVVRAECQHASWLYYQGRTDAIIPLRNVHDRARKVLGHQDPTFLSLADSHAKAQAARPWDDPKLLASIYTDIIQSLGAVHGRESTISVLPEYALALHNAVNDDKAESIVKQYLAAKQSSQQPIGRVELMKLNIAISGLVDWGEKYPAAYAELRELRDQQAKTDAPAPAESDDLAADLQILQGKWRSEEDDGTAMEQEISGRNTLLRWLDKDGKVTRSIETEIDLRRVGPFRVIEVKLPLNPVPIQVVTYRIDDKDSWTSGSGFENKNNSKAMATDWKRIKPEGSSTTPAFDDSQQLWQGTLQAGPVKLRLRFEAERQDDGSYQGEVISLDQGNVRMKMDVFEIDDESIEIVVKQSGFKFTGKLNKNKDKAVGKFFQGAALPFEIQRVHSFDAPAPPDRSQNPKPPFPYDERFVKFRNEKDGVVLAGTLTTPKGKGPFPVAILISGSGPQDRDETLLNHKPFWVLADHLTRNGIAVLRYDDRGTAKSTGIFTGATSQDFARDAESAIDFLKKESDIDAKRIGLIGHSEGGLIGPMIAQDRKDVAFLVLLAGPGIDGKQISLTQSRAILLADGGDEAFADIQDRLLREIFAAMDDTNKIAQKDIDRIIEKYKDELDSDETSEMLKQNLRKMAGPWMKFFLNHDPRGPLRKVKCPVLAINGDKDVQVLVEPNLAAIRKALQEGGNEDATVKSLKNLNHLFQTCDTGGMSEYSLIEETFAPLALEQVSSWIRERMLD